MQELKIYLHPKLLPTRFFCVPNLVLLQWRLQESHIISAVLAILLVALNWTASVISTTATAKPDGPGTTILQSCFSHTL